MLIIPVFLQLDRHMYIKKSGSQTTKKPQSGNKKQMKTSAYQTEVGATETTGRVYLKKLIIK